MLKLPVRCTENDMGDSQVGPAHSVLEASHSKRDTAAGTRPRVDVAAGHDPPSINRCGGGLPLHLRCVRPAAWSRYRCFRKLQLKHAKRPAYFRSAPQILRRTGVLGTRLGERPVNRRDCLPDESLPVA